MARLTKKHEIIIANFTRNVHAIDIEALNVLEQRLSSPDADDTEAVLAAHELEWEMREAGKTNKAMSECPKGTSCPKDPMQMNCPAGKDCPIQGAALTSVNELILVDKEVDGEMVLFITDEKGDGDGQTIDPVVDDPDEERVLIDEAALTAAVRDVIQQSIREAISAIKGRID